jgi:hypothetical protein
MVLSVGPALLMKRSATGSPDASLTLSHPKVFTRTQKERRRENNAGEQWWGAVADPKEGVDPSFKSSKKSDVVQTERINARGRWPSS